jgi:hypothetical protein
MNGAIVPTAVRQAAQAAPDSPARLGDASAVGRRAGMSPRTVYRYADAGLMPWGVKVGHLRRWDMDLIERWIAGGCKPVGRKGGGER